jgi:hypothetical protein
MTMTDAAKTFTRSRGRGGEVEVDTDIEVGRVVSHGAIIGFAGVVRDAIDADDSLTPAERALRHALTSGLQAVSHALTEVVAEAINNGRHDQ